jgi:hypothetical protein
MVEVEIDWCQCSARQPQQQQYTGDTVNTSSDTGQQLAE